MLVALGDYVLAGPDPFAAARALGADGVELRFGAQGAADHPLLEAATAAAWRSRARAAGVSLPSVYAGYIAGQPLEERRSPKVEPKNEKPTPAPAKGVVRPAPGFPPHEKPSPA